MSYKAGCYNASCFVCGRERKSDELLKRWDGVYVCREDYEPRHPQDFVHPDLSEVTPPWTQHLDSDQYLDLTAKRNIG